MGKASNWLAEVGSVLLTGAPCNYTLILSVGLSPAIGAAAFELSGVSALVERGVVLELVD